MSTQAAKPTTHSCPGNTPCDVCILSSLRADLAFLLDDGPDHAADPASHAAHASEVAELRAEIEATEKAEQEAASKAKAGGT